MSASGEAETVLDFWFGDAIAGGDALDVAFGRWFGGGKAFDREVETRFGELVERALTGDLREWEDAIRSRLALILLLDQFPRNIHRGTARAFAGDERALRLARHSVANGDDRALAPLERVFLLMPFQHAEDLDAQREGVALFAALAEESLPDEQRKLLESSRDYAVKHCRIIERFGRFPYRNAVLGRPDTDDEREWLADSPERFGQ